MPPPVPREGGIRVGLIGAVRHEVERLLGRRRLLAAVIITAALSAAWVFTARQDLVAGPTGLVERTAPMLWLGSVGQTGVLLFVWPLLAGGTLAEDLHGRLAPPLLGRIGSRITWLVSKVLATLAVSLTAMGVITAATGIAAAVAAPWDATNASIVVPLWKQLAVSAPVVPAAAAAAVLGLAAACVTLLVMVFGALGWSPLASQAAGCVAYAALALAMPGPLNPHARSDLLGTFAPWATARSTFVYWLVVLTALVALIHLLLRTREVR